MLAAAAESGQLQQGKYAAMKRLVWLSALIVLSLLPLAVQASGSSDGDDLTAAARGYRPAAIDWAPCAEDATLDCGTLRLPIEYRSPRGKSFEMAVIRARATEPTRRVGVLMTNPGGPGLSGVDMVLFGVGSPAFVRLRERFDIVSFDPRGVGRSNRVRCEVAAAAPPSDASDAELIAFYDDFSRRYARACREQNGPIVAQLGTNNVARDMDVLRRALGEQRITYASGSYGTELGAVYVSLFPEHVRAMMLDGGVAPEFRDSFVEIWTEYAAGFELSLHRLDQLCRRDADCRLQSTGVVASLDQVTARLAEKPVVSPNGVTLTDRSVRGIVSNLLFSESLGPLIVNALANAAAEDYGLFFQLAPILSSSNSALFPILCNDYGTRRSAAEVLPVSQAAGALYNRLTGPLFVVASVARCSAWPAADVPVIRDVRGRVQVPILLVGNDFDNATPLADTRSLAFALGMEKSLLRYRGGGHTAYASGIDCIDDAVDTYLFERLLPREGTSCAALPISFAQPSALQRNQDLRELLAHDGLWRGPALPLE